VHGEGRPEGSCERGSVTQVMHGLSFQLPIHACRRAPACLGGGRRRKYFAPPLSLFDSRPTCLQWSRWPWRRAPRTSRRKGQVMLQGKTTKIRDTHRTAARLALSLAIAGMGLAAAPLHAQDSAASQAAED